MKIYTDIYDRFIRAELDKKDNFKQGSLRTSSLGIDNAGVFAIVGSMESDPLNTAIHSFLFNKDRYDMDQAKKWLTDNKGEYYDEEELNTTIIESKEELNIETNGCVGIGSSVPDKELQLNTATGDITIVDSINLFNKSNERNDNMPIEKGKDKVGHFARWGENGKKYYYNPETDGSLTMAEDKAKAQGVSIEAGESTNSETFNLNTMNLNRTLFLFDQFHQESAEKLVKEMLELDADATDDINILINSFGGYTNALSAILDTMSSLKSNVNTICLGEADSCGAVLLASGNKRYIGQQSRTMIHEVGTGAFGKVSQIEKALEDAKAVNEMIIDVLSNRSGQDRNVLADIIKEDTFLSSSESVAFGIVDGLLEGEDEFLQENVLENMKINASNLDTFIFNKIKNIKTGSLATKQETNIKEGEQTMAQEDTNKQETNEVEITKIETPEVIEEPVAQKTRVEELLETLNKVAKNPEDLISYLDEQTKVNEENTEKLATYEAKENKRRQEELVDFTAELKSENKILPSEMGLVQPILDSLNDTEQLEYSYSAYGVKEKDTALGIFKKFLNNLPNRGLFGQVSEVSEDQDYDSAKEYFSKKLFNKSYEETDAKEHMAITEAMKQDPKASKLL